MTKVVLFTGAGIGVPINLPTTTQFTEDVKKLNFQITKYLLEYLQTQKKANDIEKILSTLQTFVDYQFIDFIANKTNCNCYTHSTTSNSSYNQFKNLKNEAPKALREIKSIVYDKLSKFDENKAFNLYFNLFKELFEYFNDNISLSYITTNYDLSFEMAFMDNQNKFEDIGLKDIETYFQPKGFGFEYTPKILPENKPFIEYLKIHGSLDWIKSKNICRRSGAANLPKDPDSVHIVYPGDKFIPANEPFASLHHIFYKRLLEADYIIVIGFAFRDSAINYAFSNMLLTNNKAKILIFNPLELNKFPQDSKLPYFVKYFPQKISYIQVPLEIKENPLSLKEHLFQQSPQQEA